MAPQQKAAIDDLRTGRIIDQAQFCSQYGCQPSDVPGIVEDLAKEAVSNKDNALLRAAIQLGYKFEIPDGLVHLVHEVIDDNWHTCQEEMVGMLQDWQNPESVGPLRAAIGLKPDLRHLDYDDYGAFYNRCLWALTDVGTREAIDAIKEYATSIDPVLRDKAQYRLERIAKNRAWLLEK